MRRLRLFLILIIAWLVLIFNLERPDDLLQMGNIDLASMVYILIGIVVAVVLIIPELSLANVWVVLGPLLAVYGIGKYLIYTTVDTPLVGYTTIIEVVTLIVSTLFARWVATSILGFEQTVNSVLLGRVGERILSAGECEQEVNLELLRARQYKHQASLLYVRLSKPGQLLGQLLGTPQGFQNRYMLARVVEAITELLNEYDLVGWHQRGLIIYLPEADRDKAVRLVEQLYELLIKTFDLQAEIGLAIFPRDALIFEDLVYRAEHQQIRSAQEAHALVWDQQLVQS